MKITVLGSGSAYGLPMIFNTWGKANPDNPKNCRSRASLLLEENGKSILVDAGPDLRYQINNNNVTNIDSVFITHCHYDHIAGIPELPRATKLLGHGIEVYAASKTMEELKQSYGYLFKQKAEAEPDSKSLTWNTLPDNGSFVASGLEFKTLIFPHHHIYSSAFRYKNFAYLTDWQDFTEGCETILADLDLLIVECNNGTEPEENGHSDIYKIKEIQKRFSPKHIVLSHISARIDSELFAKAIPQNSELSYDGMVLNV